MTCASRFDDRRHGIRLTGDRETYLASQRLVANARASNTLLATAGDHLALSHVVWQGAGDDPRLEIETLELREVDADGCTVAAILFDPDDRRAASRELLDRWAKGEAAPGLPLEVRRAVLARDLDGLRAALPEGFVFHDHRRSGAGRVEGADACVAWIATLLEASPDVIMEPLYYVAVERHALVSVSHDFGTLPDGGAFESV
jgi:hypothetical protein